LLTHDSSRRPVNWEREKYLLTLLVILTALGTVAAPVVQRRGRLKIKLKRLGNMGGFECGEEVGDEFDEKRGW